MKIREDYLENCKECVFKGYTYSQDSRNLLFSFTDCFTVLDISPEDSYSYNKDIDIFEEFCHEALIELDIVTRIELVTILEAKRRKQEEFKKQRDEKEYLRLKKIFEPH